MKKQYNIFISYRREGAFETASLIAEKLRSAGYDVFLDVESLRSGKFNEQLYKVIEKCTDFILILPEGGLSRCENDSDWVRKEILYALKCHKNIIPVMLNGFTWPDKLPEGLEGLNEFQSILAGGHDYFDASIDKLKSYLKSKHNKWSLKKYRLLWIIFLITFSVLGIAYWGINQIAIPVCKEQADKMSYKISIIDQLVSESKIIANDWNSFYQKYKQASPKDTAKLRSEIGRTLAFHRHEISKLQKDTSLLLLNSSQRFLLQFKRIDLVEIETFHNSLYPSFFEDVNHSIDVLEYYLKLENTPEISLSSNDANLKYIQYSANGVYYGYLEFLSDMPKDAIETYNEYSIYFKNLPSSTNLYLPRNEYERLQKIESGKAQDLLGSLGFLTTQQSLVLEQQQDNLKRIEEKNNITINNRVNKQIQHIAVLSSEITEKQQLLQNTAQKTEEVMKRIVDKCKLDKKDDQYTMWGKILRLASLMYNTRNNRLKMNLQNEKDKLSAKQNGIDVSNWFKIKYSLTTKDILNEIEQRLDQYTEYYPETKVYVKGVKLFYSLVEQGKYPLNGMVVMATKDNLPHPVLKIGDIVVARKNIIINSADDYKAAKQKDQDDSLTFLRVDSDNNLIKQTQLIPHTDVLIGLLDLKE